MSMMSNKKFLSDFLLGLFNKNSPSTKASSKDTQLSNSSPVSKASMFEEILKKTESSNNYKAVNPQGYMGAYQFGEARLQDFKDDKDKDFSKEEFLNNKKLQEEVFDWHTNDIKSYIKDRKLDKYIGQRIQGNSVTMDGLVAVAHLGGKFGMRKFLETSGEYNPSDANETKLSDYLNKFGNNEMDRLGFSSGDVVESKKTSNMTENEQRRFGINKNLIKEPVPKFYGAGEHKVKLAYITEPEAKILEELDLYNSNPPHEGPGGLPNYNDSGGSGKGAGGGRRGDGPGGTGGAEGRQRAERARRERESRARAAAEKARLKAEKAAVDKARAEAAANAREQARIDSALAAAKAADKAKEDRKKRREEGSTFSQVEQAFGPAFSSGSYGFGIYADPTSSTYNPKFNEHYGSGFSSLNYGDTQSILEGKYSSDDFTNEISIVDSIKDTIQDYTTFGEKDQLELQKFEGEGQGLQIKYNFKRGGLLDRGR